MTTEEQVEEFKNKGNQAFASGKYKEAVEAFTTAIKLDGASHVLWSNRSAAYASLRQWEAALQDAEQTVKLASDWAKGWGRKGAALMGLGRLEEARTAYEHGLRLDPQNAQLERGLAAVLQEQREREEGEEEGEGTGQTLGNPFADSTMWEKLRKHPQTAAHMQEADFIAILEELKRDPKSLTRYLKDQRVVKAFGVLLGVDVQMAPDTSSASPSGGTSTFTTPKKEEEQKPKNPLTDFPPKVLAEKELGNEAYKRRDFEGALRHYDAALSMDPDSPALLANKAAVYFEMAQYDQCIELCERAIERGREIYADFKWIARALARIGSSYEHKEDLPRAIDYYRKSLTEHRSPDIALKLKDAETRLAALQKAAYRNPAIAEQERNLGNELFKQGDYAEAIKHYTEAIKRDEEDPRTWANRAACYLKLTAVPEGIKDCDRAIFLDPTFVKAYIRKAALLFLRKDYAACLEVCERAAEHDKEQRHAAEIQAQLARCYAEMGHTRDNTEQSEEARLRAAMQNPEIQAIMSDPVMMQILQQMKGDPRAIMEHMRNPAVAGNIRKLAAAGIIRMG